jgi:uncharacterized protein (TIGR02147 family)
MVSIFNYFDYQKYLRDYYEWRKQNNAYFTYRFISSKVGIDHAYIIKVLRGQKHLAVDAASRFSTLLGHNKREREYFELLILFARAKADSESRHYFEKLLTYVELSQLKVEGYKYEFYQKWYYTAVREVIGIGGFDGDFKKLARMLRPNITEAQARQAVTLLLNLGFVQQTDKGEYALVTRFITPSEEIGPVAIRQFQKETMLLAIDALQNISRDERHISTVTVSLSPQGFEKLTKSVNRFREELLRIAHQDLAVSQAYQVNLQLFPISKSFNGNEVES